METVPGESSRFSGNFLVTADHLQSCRPDCLVVLASVAVETVAIASTVQAPANYQEPVEVLTALAILPFLAALVVGAREAEDASRNS